MLKTIKKTTAFLSAAVMVLAMLLYFPSGMFSIDFGLKASAVEIRPTEPSTDYKGVYQIGTAGELYWFAGLVNGDTSVCTGDVTQNKSASAVLTADITVNKGVLMPDGTLNSENSGNFTSWTPIGNYTSQYIGTFDGQGHTVSGLYCSSDSDYIGLFGYLGIDGSVSDTGIVESYFNGKNYVGGVCGDNHGTVTGCYNTGMVNGSEYVGGVCGNNGASNCKIKSCYNTGTVSGTHLVGGVCGQLARGQIENCYNMGTVTLSESDGYAGGVCSIVFYGTMTNCYNTGKVSGTKNVGGVCARNNYGSITNCCYLEGTAENGILEGSGSADSINDMNNADFCTRITYHSYQNGICALCGEYEEATSENGTYQITNAGQLYWFANKVNNENAAYKSVNAVLMNDITLNTGVLDEYGELNSGTFRGWTPIGNLNNSYQGEFDGQGHTVSGLYVNDSNTSYVGLFGSVESGGKVSGVGIADSYFRGNDYVGGICGENGGTITNCYNSGAAISVNSKASAGGICGYNEGAITNCYNSGNISAEGSASLIGGVCADNDGTVTNCYYLSDTADENGGKTTDQFTSGEVAYLLSLGCTVGNTTYNGEVWGQTLTGANKQDHPVLGGKKVYRNESYAGCEDNPGEPTYSYSNTEKAPVYAAHSYDNGFCTSCGGYEPAELKDGVYKIGNAGQLYWFAQQVNTDNENFGSANAVLMNDITVNKGTETGDVANCNGVMGNGWIDWTPIGNDSNMYTGTFNGQNHTVNGLYFNDEYAGAVGLFGCMGCKTDDEGNITSFAKISNISVSDSYIKGNSAVGGISGYNDYGFIINCSYKGTVIGNEYTGGVCGCNYIGLIIYCYNRGTVSGGEYIGGVCGGNNYVISNSCNRGEVSGEDSVGGVCGGNNTTIVNCYNIGTVTVSAESGEACIGGVCGYNHGTVANCYYNINVYDRYAVGDNDNIVYENVLGKTTDQFTSGEVAYLLSQGCTIGEGEEADTYDGSVWGQTLTGANKQDYPVLGGKKVLTDYSKSKYVNDIVIYGQSVTLDGTIGINVYVAADDDYTDWTASFNDKVVTTPEKDENGLYKFTYQVAAKDMEDKIKFSLSNGDSVEVSVKAYLEALDTSESTELEKLVTAMETYGNAANAFFNDGIVPEVAGVADTACDSYGFTKNAEPAGISYYGSSLILESETTVRHYFKLDAGKTIGEFTFKVNDVEVTPTAKQNYYYIDVENISAEKLGVGHTVAINETAFISNYSALSYAKAVLNSTTADDNLKNLVKTLYLYNRAAVGYNAKTGWVQDGENWYYYDDNGIMQTGWVTNIPGYDNAWFYFNENGIMQTGWVTNIPGYDNAWFYFNENGIMQTGWVTNIPGYGDAMFYFNENGIMQTGWIQDGGNWYYLNDDGTLLRNGYTPDGYYVDENGIRI